MRIVKDAETRRNENLDRAEDLFFRKGFDQTSTNDILDAVGIARGTLYYHFRSKEEVMDALILRYGERYMKTAAAISEDMSIPLIERIFRVIGSMRFQEENKEDVLAHVHKPQNALMHQKLHRMTIEHMLPIFTRLVNEGIGEGIFETPFPEECIEMILYYAIIALDEAEGTMSAEGSRTKYFAMIYNMERMLKTQEGLLTNAMIRFMEADHE
jgi:AcrR family transcriptional regulator